MTIKFLIKESGNALKIMKLMKDLGLDPEKEIFAILKSGLTDSEKKFLWSIVQKLQNSSDQKIQVESPLHIDGRVQVLEPLHIDGRLQVEEPLHIDGRVYVQSPLHIDGRMVDLNVQYPQLSYYRGRITHQYPPQVELIHTDGRMAQVQSYNDGSIAKKIRGIRIPQSELDTFRKY
ncbi:UNKNOWN [Stylonychia lemnae]|uniref:Uncharacterized protein n=1 Tax=Stylonychia lemnae TaxID=5949 RepID=A0A078A5I2_STYLE|nr:UNKNOWN [Stylonychia lemnae]|eukprot:CDW76014.1 UNKNOWN [Stylonychia lemnae]